MSVEKLRSAAAELAGRLELPADLIAGVPRVCITGRSELTVEQHRGLARCCPEEICVRVAGGQVRVTGHGLCVRRMDHAILALGGTVEAIALECAT